MLTYDLDKDRALLMAQRYGQIDGAHHKAWVIDQMVRALCGCPLIRNEFGFLLFGENDRYHAFVTEAKQGSDGPNTYAWDEGIAP